MRNVMAAAGCAVLLAGLPVAVEDAAASPPTGGSTEVAITAGGRGSATPRLIDQRTSSPARQPAMARDQPALGADGRPTGSTLPAGVSRAAKPSAATTAARVPDGPNTGGSRLLRAPSPTTVNANFAGIDQAAGGHVQPSGVNASIGATQILETVNRRVAVFDKTGVQQCTNALEGWLGISAMTPFSPRTLYDNLNDRFLIIATTNGIPDAAPRLFLAASTSRDACGSWFVYTLTFTGSLFPAGALLDYPYLGQDRAAILASTNNFSTSYVNYLNSAAWAVPKTRVYAGLPVSFPAFAVSFSTAPVTMVGVPIAPGLNTYYVAGVPGSGYRLYRMADSAGPDTTLVLQATIFAPYTAPVRRVNQCGTARTLDPLDGRIPWAPVQAAKSPFVWFTHGVDISGHPGVRYGALNTTDGSATVANAYHSDTSDDFNPSLGAFETAPGAFNIWLTWAYTDTGAATCRNTSVTFNGVLPGQGVPALTNSDRTLIVGSNTVSNQFFGPYSSVHVDPVAASGTCPVGSTALLAQEHFVGGAWTTRLARVSIGRGC